MLGSLAGFQDEGKALFTDSSSGKAFATPGSKTMTLFPILRA
jgi:hypothetical protein